MIKKIVDKLKNKKIAILGFGREGKATYRFIRDYVGNMPLVIIDKVNVYEENKELFANDNKVSFIYGDKYLDNLDIYDMVMKTPGITLKDIDTTNINITSEIELLLEVCKDRVIGVTGTKGKSTTSSLIYSILKENGKDVVLAGNVGIPVFSILEKVNEDTLFVIEMSSHQLEFLKVSPHIGIVLNLFEDHLDHAGTIKHYHEIKMKMFANQENNDYMIYCEDNEALRKIVANNDFKGIKYNVSLNDNKASIYLENDKVYFNKQEVFDKNLKRNLLGMHNLENIMTSFVVSKVLNLNDKKTLKAISEFQPLKYRLEYIGKVNNVKYYIDTLATVPSATKEALEAIPDVDTLIFGGMDRGISYDGFAEFLTSTKVSNFICMPTTGHMIGKKLPKERTYFVDTLEEACDLAKKITQENMSCILSPAAASYEQFKNYADKGEKFRAYILENR